jgi:thioredoxin reductase
MQRLQFLAPEIRSGLLCEPGGAPRLSSTFATSVPGIYMIGPVAAHAFGPLLRFAAGSGFAARRLTYHLARQARSSRRDLRQLSSLSVAASAGADRVL